MKDHYEERIDYARKSDDFEGWMNEIMKAFVRDIKNGVIPDRERQAIARMLDDASCEATRVAA